MPIRLSGMQSGLDTEALVSALVMGYRTKKEDYEKAQTKLSWKQDKWKSINTKITNFYSGTLSSNRLTSAYNLKKATINNSSYATVSASTSAVSGTQSLKVTKLASTGYLTGGKISGSGSTKLTGRANSVKWTVWVLLRMVPAFLLQQMERHQRLICLLI